MKILHLIGGNLSSGASRGAYWLHRGLKQHGVDSKILTNSSDTLGASHVNSILRSKKSKILNLLRIQMDQAPTWLYPNRKQSIFSSGTFGYDFLKTDLYKWADIIHLHWINGGLVSLKTLSKINKPTLWTLRDMWPMTGGCHYSLNCQRYKKRCGKCPQLGSAHRFDFSWWVLHRKKRLIPNSIKLVGISNWLSNCANQSRLFAGHNIQTIPNNVDCDEFFPSSRAVAKEMLGISTTKKIVLSGAQELSASYKGFDKFLDAVNQLDKNSYLLLFFGNLREMSVSGLGFEYKNLGFLHDSVSLRLAYSAADVFVAPSMMDAFGKTIAESMACGTPVACFDATGPGEIVDHKFNGYKASPYEPSDLATGIDWIAMNNNDRKLRSNSRESVLAKFDIKVVAEQYIRLYHEILLSKQR